MVGLGSVNDDEHVYRTTHQTCRSETARTTLKREDEWEYLALWRVSDIIVKNHGGDIRERSAVADVLRRLALRLETESETKKENV